jgi:hypothetical protein
MRSNELIWERRVKMAPNLTKKAGALSAGSYLNNT